MNKGKYIQKSSNAIGAIALVYFFVTFLFWVGLYGKLLRDNPVLITGYLSFLHLAMYPVIWAFDGVPGKTWRAVALGLNSCWLLGTLIANILIFTALPKYSKDTFEANPLHQILLGIYVLIALFLEVLLIIRYREESAVIVTSKVITSETPKRESEVVAVTENSPVARSSTPPPPPPPPPPPRGIKSPRQMENAHI